MVANRGIRHRFSQEESSTMTEGVSEARDYVSRGYEQAEELVIRNPMSSVLVAFTVGLGVGLWLSVGFMGTQRSLHELSTSEKAQRLGRRMLDAMSRMVPESISGRIQS
jgi:hypothetical protein